MFSFSFCHCSFCLLDPATPAPPPSLRPRTSSRRVLFVILCWENTSCLRHYLFLRYYFLYSFFLPSFILYFNAHLSDFSYFLLFCFVHVCFAYLCVVVFVIRCLSFPASLSSACLCPSARQCMSLICLAVSVSVSFFPAISSSRLSFVFVRAANIFLPFLPLLV